MFEPPIAPARRQARKTTSKRPGPPAIASVQHLGTLRCPQCSALQGRCNCRCQWCGRPARECVAYHPCERRAGKRGHFEVPKQLERVAMATEQSVRAWS